MRSVSRKNIFHKAKGEYICCYHKGNWNSLSETYQKIISFAQEQKLKLTGYAYEIGLNEFAISKEEEYITKIMVKAEKKFLTLHELYTL